MLVRPVHNHPIRSTSIIVQINPMPHMRLDILPLPAPRLGKRLFRSTSRNYEFFLRNPILSSDSALSEHSLSTSTSMSPNLRCTTSKPVRTY
jgi:hypothetical protein